MNDMISINFRMAVTLVYSGQWHLVLLQISWWCEQWMQRIN